MVSMPSHTDLWLMMSNVKPDFLAMVYGFKPVQKKQIKEVHMSKQPQNNKGTAVLGSLVFMALYA